MLAFGGPPGAHDADETFFSFRVDDDHETSIDRADCDEAVLELGVLRVEDLEIVGTRLEEPLGLPERQPVLSLVAAVLGIVPLEGHTGRE